MRVRAVGMVLMCFIGADFEEGAGCEGEVVDEMTKVVWKGGWST